MHTKFQQQLNPEGKRPIEGHSRRWEDNIKKRIEQRGYGGVDEFMWLE